MTFIFKKETTIASLKTLTTVSRINPLIPSLEEIETLIKQRNVDPIVYCITVDNAVCALAIFVFASRAKVESSIYFTSEISQS